MFTQLLSDIGGLWEKYGTVYLTGIANTLILAITATLIGCIIGFFCGILQTIPCGPNENIIKRVLLKLIRIIIRAYVEIFRGTPMILQAVFIYYGMPYFFGVSFKDIWTVSIIVVSVNTGSCSARPFSATARRCPLSSAAAPCAAPPAGQIRTAGTP